MKVTVVTVCYNVVHSIEKTMLSVLNQAYDNVEYIIIDGGSTDGTVEIIKKYSDRLAYWVSEPDNGIYDAMNKGIAAATGDYINFMNAGDSFVNDNIIHDVLDLNSCSDVIYGSVFYIDKNDKTEHQPNPFFKQIRKIKSLGICHQALFVRRSLLLTHPFDYINYRIAADYDQIKKIYDSGSTFCEVPIVVANYNLTGISSKNDSLRIKELARINGLNQNSFSVSWFCFMFRIKKVLYKYYSRFS